MKSILTFILATFLLFPLQAQEKVYTVDNLPKSSPAKQKCNMFATRPAYFHRQLVTV